MHVLVPVDDSHPAREALELAATEFSDADITALHVIDPYESTVTALLGEAEVPEKLQAETEELLAEIVELAADYGTTVETESVVGKPAREIVSYVEENDVDRVVIGSHGRRGTSRVLLGSVAELVVRRAPVPVTVVR